MSQETGTRENPTIRVRVPEALHLAAKLHATRNRRSIADLTAQALEAYLPAADKAEARRLLARAAG